MKMDLCKIFSGLILLAAFIDNPAQTQTAADAPKRREDEIWFEPTKMEVSGTTYEGERGHLMVRENRKKPNSNLIEPVFVRLNLGQTRLSDGGPGLSADQHCKLL